MQTPEGGGGAAPAEAEPWLLVSISNPRNPNRKQQEVFPTPTVLAPTLPPTQASLLPPEARILLGSPGCG